MAGALGVDAGKHEPELVAAQPGDACRPGGALRRWLPAMWQQIRVAVVVPECVVDLLEPVEVDDRDADRLARCGAPAAIACAARSPNNARLGRPVSRSCNAMCSFVAALRRRRRVTDQLIALSAIHNSDEPEHDQDGHRPVRRGERVRDRRVREVDLEDTDHGRVAPAPSMGMYASTARAPTLARRVDFVAVQPRELADDARRPRLFDFVVGIAVRPWFGFAASNTTVPVVSRNRSRSTLPDLHERARGRDEVGALALRRAASRGRGPASTGSMPAFAIASASLAA